jgi:succinate dehydrogenase / fumarate reductase cytochrome b subunit
VAWFARYLKSSIGAKHVMAVTGVLLLLFAIFHMLGHLQVFAGRAVYNGYAKFLQDLWEVKWPVRVALVVLLALHVIFAIGLVARNHSARPVRYAMFRPVVSSAVGRTMAYSGLVVFAFLAFHIWHFTILPRGHDTYGMFVHAFQQPVIFAIYLAGIALLAAHLGHGASSWLQSLGWRHPKYPLDRLGTIVAIALFVGYMAPPTAVLLGVVS